MCLKQVSAVLIQFGTPDILGGSISMLQQSYYLHVVVGSLHGVRSARVRFFEH